MDNSHRKFLQSMMTNGIVDEQRAAMLYQQCCDTYKTKCLPDKLNDFIDTINSKLQPLFMQIRKGWSEEDGQQHYALVNVAETDISRMSSDYADYELVLFRKTIELIVVSETGQASSTDILNSTDTMTTKKLKKSETEHLLNRLVRDKWLTEVKTLRYYFILFHFSLGFSCCWFFCVFKMYMIFWEIFPNFSSTLYHLPNRPCTRSYFENATSTVHTKKCFFFLVFCTLSFQFLFLEIENVVVFYFFLTLKINNALNFNLKDP
ncbi:non-structural maintenance of chromosomes element 1 homolog isoform X2 [Gouania willdenowi]|nr:non-structural maintenance of chromosomes element 1 homolog isoform X2 [Gouania willdenowi]XP_028313705.1 non-structural maintenance of chromosomes element 1 homolog isoform X2 [Gouania willdenowi]